MKASRSFELKKSQNKHLAFFSCAETLEIVVIHRVDGSVYALEGVASFIWECLEAGFNDDGIRAEAQQLGVISSEHLPLARNSPETLFNNELLRLRGLFNSSSLSDGQVWPEDYDQYLLGLAPFNEQCLLDTLGQAKNLSVFSCLQSTFHLDCNNDAALCSVFESLLANIKAVEPCSSAMQHYWLKLEGSSEYKLSINGAMVIDTMPYEQLVPRLLGLIRQLVKQDSGFEWAIHAAVLSPSDGEIRALVMPAVSGSGKTTLSALMLNQGFNYLGDELALLTKDFACLSMPVGLGVKRGSYLPLANDYAELATLPEWRRSTGLHVKYMSVPSEVSYSMLADDAPVPLQAWVFPRYSASAKIKEPVESCTTDNKKLNHLQAISVTRALTLMFEAGMHTATDFGVEQLSDLLNHLSVTPKFEVDFNDAQQVIKQLKAL